MSCELLRSEFRDFDLKMSRSRQPFHEPLKHGGVKVNLIQNIETIRRKETHLKALVANIEAIAEIVGSGFQAASLRATA
jgi:hypothetical protein